MVAPKFTVNVNSNYTLTNQTDYATALILGEAIYGDSSIKSFGSYNDVVNYYKDGSIVTASKLFFNNGGKSLKISRLVPTNAAKASIILQSSGTDAIKLIAKFAGEYGNKISVEVSTSGTDKVYNITDGVISEQYQVATNDDLVLKITENSNLVDIEKLSDSLPDDLTKTYFSGGSNGTSTEQEYIDKFNNELITEDFDYITIPGKTTDTLHSSFSVLMDTRADSENKYSVFVGGVDLFEDINTTTSRTAINQNGRLVVVHTSIKDEEDFLDGSYSASAYTGILCKYPVNTSPTQKPINVVGYKSEGVQEYNNIEREELIKNGFTIFNFNRGISSYTTVMAVTRNGNSTIWNFMLDSVRKVEYIKDNVYQKTIGFIGEPNDKTTRKTIQLTISSFLKDLINKRIIEDYQVDVREGQDPREIIIDCGIVLINETDYITFNLTLNV